MQGKVRPFNLLRRALTGIGQGFEETLRNLPARIAASNLKNYALGIKVRYCGSISNTDTATDYTATVREILHALGTISYKDAWGNVYDNMPVDRIYAGNLEDRFWSYCKFPLLAEVTIEDQTEETFLAEVILPYAPAYFSNVRRDGSFFDGMMACSLLGEEASLRFGNVGANISTDPAVQVHDVTITVDVVCCQTKECVPPSPVEFRDNTLASTTNPFIETGDLRKYSHLFVLSNTIGTVVSPVVLAGAAGSLNEMLLDLDGHVAYQGPIETLVRDIENYGDGAPFAMNGLLGLPAPAAIAQALLFGEMYSLIDPRTWEKATQGQACKRLELRGIGPAENATTIIMSERRYECPSTLYERWADREGLSAQERRDLRIGGSDAAAARLRRSEAIGVPMVVSSRKQRKE
jgi:hypothetical protein